MVCLLSLGLCRAACRRSCLLSESCLLECCADRHDATKVTLLRCSGFRFRGRGLLVVTECFTSKCLFLVKEIARTQKRPAATGIIYASAWKTFSGIFVVLFRQVSSFALSRESNREREKDREIVREREREKEKERKREREYESKRERERIRVRVRVRVKVRE